MHVQHFWSKSEKKLRILCTGLLWTISAALSAGLFASLSDGTAGRTIGLISCALVLELAKVLLWRRSGPARLMAVVLIVLSSLASLGAALQAVRDSQGRLFTVSVEEVHASAPYLTAKSELDSLDSEIKVAVARMAALPPDYVTASAKMSASIQGLRDRRQVVATDMATMEKTAGQGSTASDMVGLLAQTLGMPAPTLLLVLLLVISGSIEGAALILSLPEKAPMTTEKKAEKPDSDPQTSESPTITIPTGSHPSHERPMGSDDFLTAMKADTELPYLCGRDRTARKLGVPAGQAKRFVAELMRSGRIVAEGKRLKLAV